MKSHVFRGHRWVLGRVRGKYEKGACDAPSVPGKEIDVPIGGARLQDLDTCIHEALHACFWDLDEEAVDATAADIAAFLWRLGWRKKVKRRGK